MKDVRGNAAVEYVENKLDIPSTLAEIVRPRDLVITLGAGDIRTAGEIFLHRRDGSLKGQLMSKLNVAVLMGGNSTEREISLWTGKQILEALDPAKYNVVAYDTAAGLPFVDKATLPDVVFIALHGPGGEDGTIQGYLELLKLPYTGSKILASALAMDKAMTKKVLVAGGVCVPRDITLNGPNDPQRAQLDLLPLPVVVKPNTQGSTIGMSIVSDRSSCKTLWIRRLAMITL